MKFGKKLLAEQDIPLFRGQYVSYTTMKQLIKDIRHAESKSFKTEVLATELWWFDSTQKTSLGSTCAERISFVRAVEDEIDKTQHHYIAQVKTIKHMIADIYTRLNTKFRLDNIFSDIDSISAELLILDRFIWHAKQLILKITKKHDKMTYYKVNSWMLIRLERADFWNAKLDELIIGVSDAYTAARALQSNKDSMTVDSRQVGENENFVRKNEKYFVKPEDVMLVKLLISKHVPLDIFGRKMKKGKPLSIDSLAGLQDASVINSIYLDNKSKSMYHERTGLAGPKGNLIRIRWYGSHANPCSECWMERKTRQAVVEQQSDYVVDEAVKQRFRINCRNVCSYMSNNWHMEKKLASMIAKKQIKEKDAGAMLGTANSIQEEIVSKELNSALRTVVRRSAFQEGSDQSLRFSLDMNLHIINEDVPQEEGKWARNLDAPLKLSEVKTLPYAVLEIKTQKQAPEWVRDLKNSGYVIPSDHFSKFLYGTCKLSPNDVRFTPTWWERVLELEQTAPVSPPLIICPLLGKIPASSKFRANMAEILEQRSAEEDARAAAKSQKKEKKRDAASFNAMHTPKASIEMEKINSNNDRTSPSKDKKTAPADATVVHITPAVEEPSNNKFNLKMAFGNVLNKDGKDGKDKDGKSTKPLTAKQRAMEQRTAKTFFANERTMLSWLNHSTFMALAGITLISSGAGTMAQAGGIALVLVTILFAAYALVMYLIRLYGLKGARKGAGLDDKYGPPVLVAVFVGVMIFLAVYNIQNLSFVAQKYTVNFDTGNTGTSAL